jgi:DNA-binding transcriptional ArsR family regulator
MSMSAAATSSRQKRWWRAVWRGLVVDPEAKHYRTMGSALWLFIYLVIHANPKSGTLSRKYRTIAEEMGVSQRTVRSWLARLMRHGYVTAARTGRSQVIHISKWKNASAYQSVAQISPLSGKHMTGRVAEPRMQVRLSPGTFPRD